MKEAKAAAYLAIQRPKGEQSSAFAIGDENFTAEVIRGWRADPPRDTFPPVPEPASADFTHLSALTDALARAVDFGLSQYELIAVSSITPSLFEGMVARERVLRPISEIAELVSEDDFAALYRLTEDQYLDLIKKRQELQSLVAGVAALPKATLMSIVATFDTIVVDIVSKMLQLGSVEWLGKSERVLPLSRLAAAETIEELIRESISDEMYQFSRFSHDEQAKFIETTFGVAIKKYWKRWPDYIEVFERRNLVAHGEVAFNKRYVEICRNAGHKGADKTLGNQVELSAGYLNQACDVLPEFAILLPFSLWRKVAKDKENQAFQNLGEAAFKLIAARRFKPAERVLEFALGLEKTNIDLETRQRLAVNRASALRHDGQEDKARDLLDSIDWSASSDLFKLCVASVRGDSDKVAELLPLVKAAGAMDARSFEEWPCFRFVIEDAGVRSAFEKVFGTSMKEAGTTERLEAAADENNPVALDTLH